MSKERNRGHREAKKPKKDKSKVQATAGTGAPKSANLIAGKRVK